MANTSKTVSLEQFVQFCCDKAFTNIAVLKKRQNKKFKDVQTMKFYEGQWSMGQAVLKFISESKKEQKVLLKAQEKDNNTTDKAENEQEADT